MDDKARINALLSEAAEKVQEAVSIARGSDLSAINHTLILREMSRIPTLLRELVVENS